MRQYILFIASLLLSATYCFADLPSKQPASQSSSHENALVYGGADVSHQPSTSQKMEV